MAQFVFSAFADEISPNFDEQLSGLQKLGVGMIELRGVDGKSFTALTDGEVEAVKHKLENAGIGISALGTPIGKIKLDGDMEAHEKLLERIMDIGDMLGCKRLRVFSFYPADGMSGDEFRAGAFEAVGRMLALAEARGFTLCHENEKDIYGETPERELELLSHFGGRLKAIICGGAPLKPDMVDFFDSIGITLINGYGITECGPLISINRPEFHNYESVGQLLPGMQLRIDDPNEAGEGEICVKGPILALGYYNSREKTAESFLQNPLNHAYDERIYKTGDLGHFAPDGNLMFHGRKDRQVKHLGHRVELGEIDLAAAKVAGVEDACALYDQTHEQIWLFYTGEGVTKRDIAVALRADLPGFMVPRKIEQLAAMPRLDNGKTNMRALAERITAAAKH